MTTRITGPRPERADAAHNRAVLLNTVRELLTEQPAAAVTMDALAARSGLGKGTVYRRFGTRAGIFEALLDDEEQSLQRNVLGGRPPLGPGAPARERLIAYGSARIEFLFANWEIARASLDGGRPSTTGGRSPFSRTHIRVLLAEINPRVADLDVLAGQLTAALEGPLLLHLSVVDLDGHPSTGGGTRARMTRGWHDLVRLLCDGQTGSDGDTATPSP